MFVSFCCHGFFERHCCFTPLNVFAFFVTFLLFLCIFVHLCYCALRVALWHALAPCMVHGIGMHVMHVIIVVIIIMFIVFVMIMIIDHHDD